MQNKYKTRFLPLTLLLITTTFAFAQWDTIPNHGFESWTCNSNYCDANGWEDINSLTEGLAYTCIKATGAANVHSGSAACELYSQSVIIQNAPGICATGSINQTTQNVQGGFPLNFRPYKFKGWFKYSPTVPDTFSAQLILYSGSTSGTSIGGVTFESPSKITAWTQFSVLVDYTSAAIPDSAQIILLSSSPNNIQSGSKAYIDDLSFVNCNLLTLSTTPTATTCTTSSGSAVALAAGGAAPYKYRGPPAIQAPL